MECVSTSGGTWLKVGIERGFPEVTLIRYEGWQEKNVEHKAFQV